MITTKEKNGWFGIITFIIILIGFGYILGFSIGVHKGHHVAINAIANNERVIVIENVEYSKTDTVIEYKSVLVSDTSNYLPLKN